MEAIPPPLNAPSAKPARDPECRVPARKAALAREFSPSLTIPAGFFALGLASLAAAVAWLAFRPDLLAQYHYGPQVVALTHLYVLGFLSSIAMGAGYQLVPVALETRLRSERLAWIHLACHTIAVPGMVAMFWVWNMKQVGHFGSLFGLGVILFSVNIISAVRRAQRRSAVSLGIGLAIGWLVITMLAGLFLASAKCWPQISPFAQIAAMHAHVHLGLAGFFGTLILAVSYKLIPMFALSEIQNSGRARVSLILWTTGVAAIAATIALESPWKPAAALLATTGLGVYGWELSAVLRGRKRRNLDWGVRTFLAAIAFAAPCAVAGFILSLPSLPNRTWATQLENAYGLLGLVGFITLAVIGMLYKILPFLAWYRAYADKVGLFRTPALAAMCSQRLQVLGLVSFVAGLTGTIVAILLGSERGVSLAWPLIVLSVAALLANVGLLIRHVVRPKLHPLELPLPPRQANL